MSTILKALRRLEEDRGAQSERPLREEVTRGSVSEKPRRGGRPLLAALLGLGVAAGAGALAFWVLGRAPEFAQPTDLAAAGSAEPRGEPGAAAKRPRRPGGAKRGRKRSSPPPAVVPSAASERELPAVALESRVEFVKRPPAEPRIAASEAVEPPASDRANSELPRPMDASEIPGRPRHLASGSPRSPRAPAPSIAAGPEAPAPAGGAPAPAAAEEPPGSQGATAGAVQEASRSALPATGPEEAEPHAEQPAEAAAEPRVVAVAPQPESAAERAAPQPPAPSGAAPAREAEGRSTAPKPEPTPPEAAAEKSSKKPANSSAAAPREREPAEAASTEIARAEIPSLRVERTVWHPTAERRVALIEFAQTGERREIREGDAVGPLVVSKIEPSGVVFVHDGVELPRRIGQ